MGADLHSAEAAAAHAGPPEDDESAPVRVESSTAMDGSTKVTSTLSTQSLAPERAEVDRVAEEAGVAAPHELLVRTAAGSVVVSLALEQWTGMSVRVLRQRVLDALGQPCLVKLVLAARELLDAESLDDLVRVGGVLEVLMVASQLPRLNPEESPLEQLDTLKIMIMSSSVEYQLDAATFVRKLLQVEMNPPIQEIVDLGIVPRLVQLAGEPDDTTTGLDGLQVQTLWGLTNITSGTHQQTQVVVDAGVLPVVARILERAPNEILEQAAWLVGNVAGDSTALRDAAHAAGMLLPMLRFLERGLQEAHLGVVRHSLIRTGTWALSNMCRGTPPPALERLVPALPVISRLLQFVDNDVQTDAAWTVSYVGRGPSEYKVAAIEAGLCPHLAALLSSGSPLVQASALRAVGELVHGGGDLTQRVVDAGVLPGLVHLLSSPKRKTAKDACGTLSKIFACSRQQVQPAIDLGVFTKLGCLYGAGASTRDLDLLRNATACLTNASLGAPPEQLQRLVDSGRLEPMVQLLRAAQLVREAEEGDEEPEELGDESLGLTVLEFFESVLDVQHPSRRPLADWARGALSLGDLEPLLGEGGQLAEKASAIAQLLCPGWAPKSP
jgi:hypothetical protein